MNDKMGHDFINQFADFMKHSAIQSSSLWQHWGVDSLAPEQQQEFIQECNKRYQDFLAGVKIYQETIHQTHRTEPSVIWSLGTAKIYDYSQTTDKNAPVLFIVPSLVNHSYILDLTDETSFIRTMAKQGIRPFLLDWAKLTDDERNFTIEDYFNNYLIPALSHVASYTKKSVSIMGYCMGGLFALAAAQEKPDLEKLVLLATPWDFYKGNEWLIPWLHTSEHYLNHLIDQAGELPAQTLQYMFSMMNPLGVIRKFRELPSVAENIEKLREFASVEDWLNDCTPLAPKVAKECLFDWYKDNTPFNKKWKINNNIIKPEIIHKQTLCIITEKDQIVHPTSTEPLTKTLPNVRSINAETGHIGSIIGKKSEEEVINPIVKFLKH